MKDEAMLTTPQAAERLGVTQSRVRQFILEGRLPSQQFGRDHLIKESDLALVKTYGKAGRPKKESASAVANGATSTKATAKPTVKKKAVKKG